MICSTRKYVDIKTSHGTWQAAISDHSFGEQVCRRLKIKLGRGFSPIALLQNASDWTFVWRGRDDGFLTLALDALIVAREAEQLKTSRDSTLQWFGGEPFASDGPEEWGELKRGIWFLPAITWKLTADQSILIVQTLSREANAESRLIERMTSVLETAFTAPKPEVKVPSYSSRKNTPEFAAWDKGIQLAKDGFREARFSKVVLSRSSLLKLNISNTWLFWLEKLLSYQEESYIFALRSPDGHCFLGRSPERLLAWRDGVFQVDAIAGTRRRGKTSESDEGEWRQLKDSNKDLVEHRYVTHYVSKLLRNLRLQFETVDDEKLLQLTHVQHIRTKFQGRLTAQVDAIDLLKALHPTPAVGGLPTAEAIDFILSTEESPRGLYAGYVGWCGGESGECAIGIRSALVFEDTIRVFAGAGIVADSESEWEWEETELKMQNFLHGIAMQGSELKSSYASKLKSLTHPEIN